MPTIADVEPVTELLRTLVPAESLAHGALAVVPLVAPQLPEPGWLTLAEAGDRVTIGEVSEGGSVPDVTVNNGADRPLLLLDGEELVGAKQNRILNATVLVAARSQITIPVSCVEAGRWDYRGRHFAPGDGSLYASLRRKKAEWVSRSIREGRGQTTDQGAIWDELADKQSRHGVLSPTRAMRDFYAQFEQGIEAARAALAPVSGQTGALVYLSGQWIGGDILPSPGVFARAWDRLCPGYAADAIGTRGTGPLRPRPPALLRRFETCPVEAVPAVGLGAEYRLTGLRTTGAALVAEERVAHLMVFPAFAMP